MKIDFSAPILDLKGEPLTEGDVPVTLGKLAVDALMATMIVKGEAEQLDGNAKVRNFLLASRIFEADAPIDVNLEDANLIKERIGRAFTPLAVGRAWKLLEGDGPPRRNAAKTPK